MLPARKYARRAARSTRLSSGLLAAALSMAVATAAAAQAPVEAPVQPFYALASIWWRVCPAFPAAPTRRRVRRLISLASGF